MAFRSSQLNPTNWVQVSLDAEASLSVFLPKRSFGRRHDKVSLIVADATPANPDLALVLDHNYPAALNLPIGADNLYALWTGRVYEDDTDMYLIAFP